MKSTLGAGDIPWSDPAAHGPGLGAQRAAERGCHTEAAAGCRCPSSTCSSVAISRALLAGFLPACLGRGVDVSAVLRQASEQRWHELRAGSAPQRLGGGAGMALLLVGIYC